MDKNKKNFKEGQESKATTAQINLFRELGEKFKNNPLPDDELLVNLGMFQRSSQIAKILFLNELYELIYDVPGSIMEFGCWWGQNLCVFENLRAIYEPFNQNRKIIGFDTFTGYTKLSNNDISGETVKESGHALPNGYENYLNELISCHERINVLGHLKKHSIVKGDVTETLPKYLKDNPETIISLAYIDLALYNPCKIVLKEIKPHLVPGSVILFDELNWNQYPGETIAFREELRDNDFTIFNSKFIRDRTIVKMK